MHSSKVIILLLTIAGMALSAAPGLETQKEEEKKKPEIEGTESSSSSLSLVQIKPLAFKSSSGNSKEKLETSDSYGLGYYLPPHFSAGLGPHGHGIGPQGPYPPAAHIGGPGLDGPGFVQPPPPHPIPVAMKYALPPPIYYVSYIPGFYHSYRNHGYGGYGQGGHGQGLGHGLRQNLGHSLRQNLGHGLRQNLGHGLRHSLGHPGGLGGGGHHHELGGHQGLDQGGYGFGNGYGGYSINQSF